MDTGLSTSRLNRSGRILRDWWRNGMPALDDRETGARLDLVAFRASHRRPLIKATNGLRSMVRIEGCEILISQRLKRMITILDKLERQPTMALSKMQDIGGCRAILNNMDEVRRVQQRLTRRRPPVRVSDYVAAPRDSGYRAIHLVVQYDERCVEVQLRTRAQHDWAVAVERWGGKIAADLKSGEGPPEVLQWLEAVSEAMALEESGEEVDTQLSDRIGRLKENALALLGGTT